MTDCLRVVAGSVQAASIWRRLALYFSDAYMLPLLEVVFVALNADITRIVARQQELRTRIDAIVADLEGGDA